MPDLRRTMKTRSWLVCCSCSSPSCSSEWFPAAGWAAGSCWACSCSFSQWCDRSAAAAAGGADVSRSSSSSRRQQGIPRDPPW